MDIVQTLGALANTGAGWVMWLLIGLSVAGLAIVVERTVVLFMSRDDVPKLADELGTALSRGDRAAARHRLQESPSFEARVASAGLAVDDVDAARERMAGASALARLEMERNLAFLGTLGNNAPFIGLLGTVIGVIRAFHELGVGGGQVSANLMQEIGEALVATAVGLLVALPAVVFFNVFQRVIRARLSRAEALGSEVVAHLHEVGAEASGS